jgi:hypothetical protein
MNEEAQINIRRSKSYADRLRAYTVQVDHVTVASLAADQSATVPIMAGRHTLRLRIDWCGSEELQFEAQSREQITFECGSKLTGWRILLALFYVLFRTRQYLWLRRTA